VYLAVLRRGSDIQNVRYPNTQNYVVVTHIVPSIVENIRKSVIREYNKILNEIPDATKSGERQGLICNNFRTSCLNYNVYRGVWPTKNGLTIREMLGQIHDSASSYISVVSYEEILEYCTQEHQYPRQLCIGFVMGTCAYLPFFLCSYKSFDIVRLCYDANIDIPTLNWGEHIINPYYGRIGAVPQFHISFFYLIQDLCRNGMNWRTRCDINRFILRGGEGGLTINYYMQLPEALLSVLAKAFDYEADKILDFEDYMLQVFYIVENILPTIDDLFYVVESIGYGMNFNMLWHTPHGGLVRREFIKFANSYHQRIDLFTLLLKIYK
jgi:hypothetical protein